MGIRAAARRLTTIEPVWWLNAVIGTAAVVLYLAWIRHLDPILGPDVGWWWALGIIVFVTERWPVEVEFRRSTHSFSLTDIPLTLALIFTSGTHAFVAVMAGALVALLLRRASAVKFVFNLAQFALVTCVLIVIVHVAAAADPGFGWITWGAVLAAAQIGSVLTIAQILAAIVLDRGPGLARPGARDVRHGPSRSRSPARRWRSSAASSGSSDPRPTPLLLIPILIAFVGYRAYVQERRATRRSRSSTRPTAPSRSHPRSPSRSRVCSNGRSRPSAPSRPRSSCSPPTAARRSRTSLGPGAAREAMAPVDAAAAAALRTCAADARRRRRAHWRRSRPTLDRLPRSIAGSATACSACCAARIA